MTRRTDFSPGPGWVHLAGSVWERCGVRVHLNGLARLPDGSLVFEKAPWDTYTQVARLIRINGGSRKRGLLAWGRMLVDSLENKRGA
jgi:hypothetical protein